mmetsp:Transcript_2110/g.7533  ORF Transcript_2110/g.7533 Transcript_2110/m.7533 type:complete len:442 (-) Transcript_2110:107-1432(-)
MTGVLQESPQVAQQDLGKAPAPPPPYASVSGLGEPNVPEGEASASADEFEVMVLDPVKLGEGVQAYVSYRVSTKTTLPQYRYTQFSVIRRYSDFVRLHARLADKNSGIIIPPLPEKNVVAKYSFNTDFIESRRRALEKFLQRCAKHPQLRESTDLQIFLEASEEAWAAEKNAHSERGTMAKKGKNVGLVFKGLGQSITNALTGDAKGPTITETSEYLKAKDYMDKLEVNLTETKRQIERLNRRAKELSSSLAQFGVSIILLGASESGTMRDAFTKVGNKADELAQAAKKQAEAIEINLEEPFKEYIRYVMSVKDVMEDRATLLLDLRTQNQSVSMKTSRLEKLRGTQAPPEKVKVAERELQDQTRKAEVAKERYDSIVQQMDHEMATFYKERSADIQTCIREYASSQVRLSNEAAVAWKAILPALQALHEECKEQVTPPSA